jgi:hypothetical protein
MRNGIADSRRDIQPCGIQFVGVKFILFDDAVPFQATFCLARLINAENDADFFAGPQHIAPRVRGRGAAQPRLSHRQFGAAAAAVEVALVLQIIARVIDERRMQRERDADRAPTRIIRIARPRNLRDDRQASHLITAIHRTRHVVAACQRRSKR